MFLQILSHNHVFVFWFCGFSLGCRSRSAFPPHLDGTTFISPVLSVSPPPSTSHIILVYFVFESSLQVGHLFCSPDPAVACFSLFLVSSIDLHLAPPSLTCYHLKNVKWRLRLLTLRAVSTRAAWSFIWSRVNLMDVNSIVTLLWLSVGLHRLLGEISGSLAAWCSATFTS